jgi:hypothetical protein
MSDESGWPQDEVTRRRLLAGAGVAAAGGALLAAEEAQAAVQQVGVQGTDRRTVEYIGQINQVGETLITFGYLTRVQGVPASKLFTRPRGTTFEDPDSEDESAARFTFHSKTTLQRLSRIAHHLAVSATGGLGIFFQPSGGAHIEDPDSFAKGTRIAAFDGHYQNKLVLFEGGPQEGQWATVALTGDLVQKSATTFSAGAGQSRLGRTGLRWALDATGEGHLDETTGPKSHINFMGTLSVQDAAQPH